MEIVSKIKSTLKTQTCYDTLPQSYKLIVFDNKLLIKKALAALLLHGLHSAPLWNSDLQTFQGMLTGKAFLVTDFIHLILFYYNESTLENDVEDIEHLQIFRLKELLKQNDLIPTLKVSIHPMDSLYEASKLLLKHKLHRLPLLDVSPDGQEMLLSVLTQHKILRQIALNVEDCIYLDFTPKSVGIGTYGNIATAELTTPLVDLLNTLVEKRLSSLPILDSKGIVVDVCEKYDILNLARENSYYDLGMPVSECLNRRSYDFEGIHRCHLSNTLGNVMDTIKDKLVHRFVVVDDNDFLLGVISLSDVLTFFTKD